MSDELTRSTGAGAAGVLSDDDGRSPEDRAFLDQCGEELVIRFFAASKTLRGVRQRA